MAIGSFCMPPRDAATWGSYDIRPTDTGIRLQIRVMHPRNDFVLGALIASSILIALIAATILWTFAGTLLLLLTLVPLAYLALYATRLTWIEVRPDGLAITRDAARPDRCRF